MFYKSFILIAAVIMHSFFSSPLFSQTDDDLDIDQIGIIESEEGSFRLEIVTKTGDVPFGMAFLPDGRLLVGGRATETIYIVDVNTGAYSALEDFTGPYYEDIELGGMIDILIHPDYAQNGWIYYSYSGVATGGYSTYVERARLDGNSFTDIEKLHQSTATDHVYHSSRLALKDGYLFIAESEHEVFHEMAQDPKNTLGKVVRLYEDGRIPQDNPFIGKEDHQPSIWTTGHRNPHGMAFNPATGDLWLHEHGPAGGDEINIVRKGRNYGWPVITYGEEYEGGPVGEGFYHKEGMEQPVFFWKTTIAPSGMVFYEGDAYKNWNGNLFIGAMIGTYLSRLTVVDQRVINEEILLKDQGWRIRDVRQSPDGLIYFGIDAGYILRLIPVADE